MFILSYLFGIVLFLGGSNSEVISDNGFNNTLLLTRNHTKRRINEVKFGKTSSSTFGLSKELLAEGKGKNSF